MKDRANIGKRLVLFVIGMFLAGLGVAFSTLPTLGTSPITSLPYVMTLILPWSLGTTTIVFNVGFILIQYLILRKRFPVKELLQLPTLFIFGAFIDLGMWMASCYVPTAYPLRMFEVLLGCLFLALGIALQLISDISLMPGDGVIKTISNEFKIPFGKVKICFDFSIVISALILSLAYFQRINGIREGTIVAAFLVGWLIRKMQGPLTVLRQWVSLQK